MRLISVCGLWLLTTIASFAAAAPVSAGEYRDAVYHFRVDIPPGWRAMTEPEWKGFLEGVKDKRVDGKPIVFIAGFRPEKGEKPFSQIVLSREAEWTQSDSRAKIERDFGRGLGMPIVKDVGNFGSLVQSAGDTRAVLDWGRNRLVFVKAMQSDPGVKLRYTAAMQLCKSGTVNIFCYSAPETFDDDLPAFQVLNDSFALDAGFEFQPPPDRNISFLMGQIAGGLICCGLPIVGIVVLVVALTRRNRRPKRPRYDEDSEDEED